jgi:hypothetical protein
VIAGLGAVFAAEQDSALVTFNLDLVTRATDATRSGTARVMIEALPEATPRRVQAWTYRVCGLGVELRSASQGSSLAAVCSQAGASYCAIDLDEQGVTVDVLLSENPGVGIPEANLHGWEDVVITYRCPELSCDYSGFQFCPQMIGETEKHARLLVEGNELRPSESTRWRLLACNAAEKLAVVPVLRDDGRVGIYFRAASNVPPCLLGGWSYGICLEDDLALAALDDPEDFTGADTFTARKGNPPAFNLADHVAGGIARSVVLDFVNPVGVDAADFGQGFEDLILTFTSPPCGTIRICDQEVGTPLVDAVWSNLKEDSLDIIPAGLGRLDLCWRRADTNFDGLLNVGDAVNVLTCLFRPALGHYCSCIEGDKTVLCADVMDTNNDGRWNVADGVYLLEFLFLDGAPIAPLRG